MGFDFKVVYRKGAEYSAAEDVVLNALPILVPNWLEPIKEATLNEPSTTRRQTRVLSAHWT